MPNIEAVMVVLRRALGGGATTTLRIDQTGKAMANALLRMPVDDEPPPAGPALSATAAGRREGPLGPGRVRVVDVDHHVGDAGPGEAAEPCAGVRRARRRCTRPAAGHRRARPPRPARAAGPRPRRSPRPDPRLPRTSGTQPSARVAIRRSAASDMPPTRIGIGCAGRGSVTRSRSSEKCSPSTREMSPVQTWRQMSIHSSSRAPRDSNGTPRASNSSRIQPAPSPATSRPPEMASMLASCLARTSGWRRPASRTAVPISTRSVTTAIAAHQTIGSYQGSFGSHLIVPSSVNG